MTDLALRLAIGAAAIALSWYQHGTVLTVDGKRLMMRPRPEPFHLRWLVPLLCGKRMWTWTAVTWLSLLATCVMWPGDLWSVGLWVCLPWYRTMATAPVLVDAPALAMSLASLRLSGPVAIAVGGLSAVVSERAPVWFALYGWQALPAFAGLTLVLAAMKWIPSAPRDGMSALKTGRARAMRWTSPIVMLAPWGAGVAALLSQDWTLREMIVVVVAYGQMLVAYDTARMYQWAAPVVLPKAVGVIPTRWLPVAVMATLMNPWGSDKKGQVVC